ncbi:glycosyltransferase, partial [bacterium]|nr:glycosyltransferase [bacterium]
MRIAFLNLAKNEDWGGGEKWTLVSACGLAEREHHVVVIGVEGSLIVKRAKNSGLEAFSIRVGIDYSPRGIFNVLRILKKSNIEILVVHHHKDVRIGGVSAKILGVPVVHRNGFPIISDNIRHRFTHRFVDRILTNSKRIADRYQTIDWINESEIDIVPNGIRIPDSTQKNNSLRKLWTDKNCLIAAYAGRLTSVKRPDDLLTAFSLLKPDSRWKLVIIGDGHLYEHLRNRINLDGL